MRVVLVFISLILLQLSSFSMDTTVYCPKTPYNLSSNMGSKIAKYSGANFLTKQLIENLLKNTLKKELNTDFDVNLKPFDNNNLLNGKFQSLSVFGQNASKNGLFFSTISAQTVCGFNHIKYENETLYFVENMVVKFSARMNEDDLNKIINSNEYVNYIKNMKIKANSNVLAEISQIETKIENNKINLKINILIPFVFGTLPQSIDITTGLNIENGKIVLDNIKSQNQLIAFLLQNSDAFISKINPFVFKVQTKDKYDIMLNVENVKIDNNEIFINGTLVVPKNYEK